MSPPITKTYFQIKLSCVVEDDEKTDTSAGQERTEHGHFGVRRAHQSSAYLCECIGFFFGRISWLNRSQKRKERVSSNSSIESRDSETSSPADKKKRSQFSEDGDVSEALNMSVSENIQHILERLGKLDTLEILLTKSLAKLEKLETRVNGRFLC